MTASGSVTVPVTVDTSHLAAVLRIIAKHAAACAAELEGQASDPADTGPRLHFEVTGPSGQLVGAVEDAMRTVRNGF